MGTRQIAVQVNHLAQQDVMLNHLSLSLEAPISKNYEPASLHLLGFVTAWLAANLWLIA